MASVQICLASDGSIFQVMFSVSMLFLRRLRLSSTNKCLLTYTQSTSRPVQTVNTQHTKTTNVSRCRIKQWNLSVLIILQMCSWTKKNNLCAAVYCDSSVHTIIELPISLCWRKVYTSNPCSKSDFCRPNYRWTVAWWIVLQWLVRTPCTNKMNVNGGLSLVSRRSLNPRGNRGVSIPSVLHTLLLTVGVE